MKRRSRDRNDDEQLRTGRGRKQALASEWGFSTASPGRMNVISPHAQALARLAIASTLNVLLVQAPASASDPLLRLGSALPDDVVVWTAKNFGRHLARASDAHAVEFGQLLGETAAHLARSNPSACIRMLLPSAYGPLRARDWPKQFLDRQMAVQRRIVQDALSSPAPEPNEEAAGHVVDQALQAMRLQYGEQQVKALASPPTSATDSNYCIAWARYYQLIASLPARDASLAIRWLNAP